jgi:hypothetical protein
MTISGNSAEEPTGGEAKIQEYLERISQGESPDEIMRGLPPSFRDSLIERLGARSEKTEDSVSPSYSEDDLLKSIPPQYRGLSSDVLTEIWNIPITLDAQANAEMQAMRARVIGWLQHREQRIIKQAEALQRKREDAIRLQEIRERLDVKVETEELEISTPLSSRDVSNKELFKSPESLTPGVDLAFLNNDHEQDAFTLGDDVIAISDGMSSYGRSGLVSALLAQRLAEQANARGLEDIFKPDNLTAILEEIKEDEHFKSGKAALGLNIKERDSGLATALVLKRNQESKSLDFACIGDSPLFVFDYDESGNLLSFNFVNGEVGIDNANYFGPSGRSELEDPRTHGLGVRENGKLHLDTKALKTGQVPYKKGRVVVAASDFFTKMLTFSPEALKAKSKMSKVPKAAELYEKQAESNTSNFPELWVTNPATGDLTLDPSFVRKLSKSQLEALVGRWKRENSYGSDDMTIAVIEMDKYFETR